MKRTIRTAAAISACILTAFLPGCTGSSPSSSGRVSASSADEFTQSYILTAFYGTDTDRDNFIQEKKEEGILHQISYDSKSGFITVSASLTQAQYWVEKSEDEIEQNSLGINKDDHYSISVNASDTEMTITTSSDWNLNHLQETVNDDLMAMEIHQVFSGISSWHIDVRVVDSETNETVRTCSLPDERPDLTDDIWKS